MRYNVMRYQVQLTMLLSSATHHAQLICKVRLLLAGLSSARLSSARLSWNELESTQLDSAGFFRGATLPRMDFRFSLFD